MDELVEGLDVLATTLVAIAVAGAVLKVAWWVLFVWTW